MGHLLTHHGFSAMKRDKSGRAPLHYAAGRFFRCLPLADNRYSCIQLLLGANADVNAVDERGRTALQYIAIHEAGYRFMPDHFHPESPIQLLLQRGANPNICDVQGETALHCASRCGWVDKQTLQILVKHGDLNVSNENGETCLHVLMNNEMPDNDVLKMLLDGGANPNAQDVKGRTPLHLLVEKSRFFRNPVQTANTLLKYRLNVNAHDNEGKTPLHILARATGPLCNHRQFPKGAASVGHNILELLLSYGADVRAQDLKGSTPYELIVKNDRIASRTSHLVTVVSSQGSGETITVSTSKKAPIRPYDSTPHPWEGGEQSNYRNGIWSVPAVVLPSTAARM
ncbi:ankyrin [Armillaria gallica]|uniref:Ankyrin n=1 Tax=Armillaria gallica TaxID=47427 RepID=A0A2H3D7N8_ARMGA|nr:ankyrin [Armillaria gallica]